MTTILLPTFGSSGDVNPFMILGRELQRRGHQAILITNPYFQMQIEDAGLGFIGVGDEQDYLNAINDPDLWHPTRSFYMMARHAILGIMRPVYDVITQFDPTQTIIAAPGVIFGAQLAHEADGFPYATLQLQPSVFRSVHDTPVQGSMAFPGWTPAWLKRGWFNIIDRQVIDKTLGPAVNAFREELGLAPVKHFFAEYIHSPQLSIGLFPDWFAPIQSDWPPQLRLTGFIHAPDATATLSAKLTAFLDAGPPPVVFTPGSAMLLGNAFFAAAAEACAELGCRGVLVTRHAEQLPSALPDGVIHVPFAPFDTLLPRTAALVYHGGIGTMAQALAAGIPHLVMPMGHDQPDNARRLERLGVGKTLPPKKFTAQRVAGMLDMLLNDEGMRSRCHALSQRVNFATAINETCDLILILT